MRPIRAGVVGLGYWGPKLARNLRDNRRFELRAVADANLTLKADAQRRYPEATWCREARSILAGRMIDAVAIATPVSTHYDLGVAALEAGKHVLMAKPLAGTRSAALQLANAALAADRVLLVDHTFVYCGAVRKIRELLDAGELGRLLYVDSVRVNLGLFQQDADVLWDLAPHDLSIIAHLAGPPDRVAAVSAAPVRGGLAELAYLTCWCGDALAHAHVNWLSPVKVRRTIVGCDRRMVVWDDLSADEKVRVYDRGADPGGDLVEYRTGDMWAPKLDDREALAVEVDHFADCVEGKAKPLTGPREGLEVVRLLEAASASIAQGGCPVGV